MNTIVLARIFRLFPKADQLTEEIVDFAGTGERREREDYSVMHRIQLKGPWEYRMLSSGNAAGEATGGMEQHLPSPEGSINCPSGTIKFPAPWHAFLGESRGTVEFRRPFNCPTNLSANDRVDLVLDGVGGHAEVKINGNQLGEIPGNIGRGRFNITPSLRLHNEIRVTVTRALETPDPAGLWGTVSLEIHDTTSI